MEALQNLSSESGITVSSMITLIVPSKYCI